MRGLRKYLTPFAPDQSGAVSVLFELGGIVVICDAGDVPVMYADLTSRGGLNRKVRSSAPDFEIWMRSLDVMTVW